jgi:hypothetical protein
MLPEHLQAIDASSALDIGLGIRIHITATQPSHPRLRTPNSLTSRDIRNGMPTWEPARTRRSRRGPSIALIAGLALATAGVACNDSMAANASASPSTLASVFAAAGAGDTILLEAGDYGTFRGAMKAGMVTLRSKPGAVVKIEAEFSPAANITLDGVNLEYALIANDATHDITIRNADVTGPIVLRTGELHDADILLDHNVHRDWDACGDCVEGRISLTATNARPSGVTIQNSEFRGGFSDGIQDASNGTRIVGNSFHDIPLPDAGGAHVDALQLLGTDNTVIKGNYFARVPTGIMAADGVNHATIEDNVFAGTPHGYPYAITLFSDVSSVVSHNTLADGACGFNVRCGVLRVGSKPGSAAGRGTIIKDNILSDISVSGGPATTGEQHHNLIRAGGRSRGTNLAGLPTYRGGAQPKTFADHALSPSSLGVGDGSDGANRGARFDQAGAQDANAAPAGSAGGARAAGLAVSDASINARTRRLRVVAPISKRASGPVSVTLRSAGRTARFTTKVDAGRGRVVLSRRLSRRQARSGTGIVTIHYAGNDATYRDTVRVRAARRGSGLTAQRPRVVDGRRLRSAGTISGRARGVVRVRLQLFGGAQVSTRTFSAPIRDGRWRLDRVLPRSMRTRIAEGAISAQSTVIYTGYSPAQISGSARTYRVALRA